MTCKLFLFGITVTGMSLFIFPGCNEQHRDVSIKEDLAAKAKTDLDFAGVRFVVNRGVVTLNGACATSKGLNKVYATVKTLYGVQGVVNNLRITDIVIGTDLLLKQAVDSILLTYPGVEGITRDSTVLLSGKLELNRVNALRQQVLSLKPKKLEQRLVLY